MGKRFLAITILIFFLGSGYAAIAREGDKGMKVQITPDRVEQGGVALIKVSAACALHSVQGECKGESLLFFPDGRGSFASIIGIDLKQKSGVRSLRIRGKTAGGKIIERSLSFRVLKKDFPVQRLTLPKGMVELSPKDLARVKREHATLMKVFNASPTKRQWKSGFAAPLHEPVISAFGLRRILNGEPRSPHTGIDLHAFMGEPVRASAAGTVVYTANQFFSGRSVFIDHGMGIVTMYFHLSKIEVKEGEHVLQGQEIGKAGDTGRATGPHLHWGVRIRGNRVDPMALLALFKPRTE